MGTDFQCQHKPYRESRTSSWSLFIVVVDCSVVESLPWETRSTLCIILLIAWCQDCGSKESLTVFVPSAYLVASSGKLLWRAGNAAIVLVFGAISAGLQQHKVIGSCHTLAARKRECSTWHSVVPSPLTSVLKRPGKDIRTKHSLSWRGKGELGCHTPWQWPFRAIQIMLQPRKWISAAAQIKNELQIGELRRKLQWKQRSSRDIGDLVFTTGEATRTIRKSKVCMRFGNPWTHVSQINVTFRLNKTNMKWLLFKHPRSGLPTVWNSCNGMFIPLKPNRISVIYFLICNNYLL